MATVTMCHHDPLNVPQATPIRGVHYGQLRQAIDAVRRSAGLVPKWSSYAPLTGTVSAATTNEMRGAIMEAYGALALPPPVWTRNVLSGGWIAAIDVTELRNSVK